MLRALPALAAVFALAACGGDGGGDGDARDTRRGPDLAEWRLDIRERCREHSEQVLRGVRRLPETRKRLDRFERRVLLRERRFVRRLARAKAPASERIGFRKALDDRRRAVDAQLDERMGDARRASRRAGRALERMNLLDCTAPGAYAVPDGLRYANERGAQCRRRLPGLRRAAKRVRALPIGEAKLDALMAFAGRLRSFGRRAPIDGAIPPAAEALERRAFREVRAAGQALVDAAHAARRIDRAAVDAALARGRRNSYRGAAAWWVLNIPACEAIYKLRID